VLVEADRVQAPRLSSLRAGEGGATAQFSAAWVVDRTIVQGAFCAPSEAPGVKQTICEITPVSGKPIPKPD
jgi:hypothetical protein